MTENWQRFASVTLLALLGGGILIIMGLAMASDGQLSAEDGGWLAAAFLSLREVMGKIENISLGVRTPAPPLNPTGEQP